LCGAPKDDFVLLAEGDAPAQVSHEGEPETLEDVRDRARDILKGVCAVYPRCDGAADKICQREAYGKAIGMGGVGSGQSFRANLAALAGLELRTQLVGSQLEPDTRLDFFGIELESPVIGASTSGVSNYHPTIDEVEFCRSNIEGCRSAGTISWRGDTFFYTEDDHPSLKAIGEAKGHGVQIFKPRAQDVLKRLIARAEEAGCPAVGVDLDGCGSTNMARAGQPVFRKGPEEIAELVKLTSLPFITKGVMDPDDAEACVDAGAKVVAVSNHGGRVLDATPGVADVLPGIAKRIGGRAMITADGGVRTGFDVLKMLALGADAVLIGRDLVRSAIGGKSRGVQLHVEHVTKVLAHAMLMTGCADLSAIDHQILVP